MVLQDHDHERQAESHAGANALENGVVALGREMRLRAMPADLFGHADAVVLQLQNGMVPVPPRAHCHGPLPGGSIDESVPAAALVQDRRLVGLVAEVDAHLEGGVAGIEEQILNGLLQMRQVAFDPERCRAWLQRQSQFPFLACQIDPGSLQLAGQGIEIERGHLCPARVAADGPQNLLQAPRSLCRACAAPPGASVPGRRKDRLLPGSGGASRWDARASS